MSDTLTELKKKAAQLSDSERAELALELTRFRGQLILWKGRESDAESKNSPIPA
jgi:hypothetical protein